MNVYLGRGAAALASLIVLFVLNIIGLDVTDEQTAGVIAWLTEGLTALGGFFLVLVYSFFHKLINKKLNPGDVARSSNIPRNL